MKAIGWIGLLLAGVVLASGCQWDRVERVEETRALELPATTVEMLEVETGSGDLSIVGDKEASSIEAKATIKRSPNVSEEDIIFTLEQEGNTAKLVLDQKTGPLPRMVDVSLTVKVPAAMNLVVKDGSGDTKIKDIDGSLVVHDDSGDLEIFQVSGELEVYDQSGDLHVTNASNIKRINDDSGDMILNHTKGDMQVHDQSGSLTINNHVGDITIWDDSGNLNIDGVEGNVTLEEKGSGDQTVKNIKGSWTEK